MAPFKISFLLNLIVCLFAIWRPGSCLERRSNSSLCVCQNGKLTPFRNGLVGKLFNRTCDAGICNSTLNYERLDETGDHQFQNLTIASEMYTCAPNLQMIKMEIGFDLIKALMMLSIACLLVTTVYLLDIGNGNCHTRAQMCCVLSLLMAYCFALARFFLQNSGIRIHPVACYVLYAACYVSCMWVVTWYNVLGVDAWITFGFHGSPLWRYCSRIVGSNPFSLYSVYAWGAPVLLGAILMAVELYDVVGVYSNCCFYSRPTVFHVAYCIPVGLMIGFNILFYAITVVSLRKTVSDIKVVSQFRNINL